MRIEFDERKSQRNAQARGLPFQLVARLDWDRSLVIIDDRQDYGEMRLRIFGPIEGRLHAIVVTPVAGGLRVISLRKANSREVTRYEQQQT